MFHWIQLKGRADPQRSTHEAAVVVQNQVYSFGGNDNNNDNIYQLEVLVFNTVTWRWAKLTPKTDGGGERQLEAPYMNKCEDFTAVLIGDVVYTWGRCHDRNLLYGFDVVAHMWFKPRVSGTFPEGRYNHTACALWKVMFIHGGILTERSTNDVYKLDTSTMVWSLINTRGTPPPDSFGHSATIIGTKMFVSGGFRAMGYWCDLLGDWKYYSPIRVFDTETNCWLDTPPAQLQPKEQEDLSRLVFAYNGELYTLREHRWNRHIKDLWKFSPETFCWKKVEAKEKRPSQMYGNCCCMVGDRIIFFGREDTLDVLDLSPSLKTFCKLAVIHYGLDQSGLPHNIRWELEATTTTDRN